MKLKVVNLPSIVSPIQDSPGFAKKDLSTHKLDIMGLCQFSCSYCSTNSSTRLRIHREEFADETERQLGERIYPGDPSLTFAWPDVEERLLAQLATKQKTWGAGKVLIFSQLTDSFAPTVVASGLTMRVLILLLERTSFRIRILTKSALVARDDLIALYLKYPGRFVVGLSIGTLDDDWASKVEIGTSSPTARVKALHKLQNAGVPTFGMLCPIFFDALRGKGVEQLIQAIRPDRCETVWAEPYNDRDNWRVVRAGYAPESYGYGQMTAIYEKGDRAQWSAYATGLYTRLRSAARAGGWLPKLKYLLYEAGIAPEHLDTYAGLEGVLLQSPAREVEEKADPAHISSHSGFAALQARLPPGAGLAQVFQPKKPKQASLLAAKDPAS